MILPMMGFVFVLFVAGSIGGGFLYAFTPLRPFSPFALAPIAGAIGALVSSCVLAIALEAAFGSLAGGLGFFGGYSCGGLVGAWLGYRRAIAIRRQIITDISVVEQQFCNSAGEAKEKDT